MVLSRNGVQKVGEMVSGAFPLSPALSFSDLLTIDTCKDIDLLPTSDVFRNRHTQHVAKSELPF